MEKLIFHQAKNVWTLAPECKAKMILVRVPSELEWKGIKIGMLMSAQKSFQMNFFHEIFIMAPGLRPRQRKSHKTHFSGWKGGNGER